MSNTDLHERIREQSFDPNPLGHIDFDKTTGKYTYNPGKPAVGSSQVILEGAREGFAAEANPSGLPPLDGLYGIGKLFEKDTLRNCRILSLGLGSLGSPVAVNLAREGILYFTLIDFDRVELHNLSRHIGGVRDLDRLKTDVVEEHILRKNPYAQIKKLPIDITQHRDQLEAAIIDADITFCSTDNPVSRYVISSLANQHAKTVIYGWADTRAEGVNVFVQRPGEACYGCLAAAGMIGEEEITNEASARESGAIPAYTPAADANAIVQVGLPSDIDPMINMMVKLGLTELTRDKENSGIENLSEELRDNYFVWANRRTRRFLSYNPFNEPKDGPTILRWYSCAIPRIASCGICSEANR